MKLPSAIPRTTPRKRILFVLVPALTLALLVLAGCAHLSVTSGTVVPIVIGNCRTAQEYYYANTWTKNGADIIRFENKDGTVLRLDFYGRWPFTGLPHEIYLQPHSVSRAYPMYQFANQKAAGRDTFLFKITGDPKCGSGPTGPGIITDD